MLPSDPEYKSSAPATVQEMLVFQQMLKDNYDPYSSYWYNSELCQMLEIFSHTVNNNNDNNEVFDENQ